TAPGPGTPSTGGRELTAAPPVIDRGRLPCRSRHRYLVYSLRPSLPGTVYRHAMAFGELSRGGPLPGVVRGGGGGGELRRADRRRTHRCCRSHLVSPPSTPVAARRGRRAGAVSPEPTTRPGRPARRDRSGGRLRARRHCRAA